jgi:hypothetical protein
MDEVIAVMQRQGIAELCISRFPPRLISAHGMNMRRASFLHQRPEFVNHVATPQDQRHTMARQIGGQCRQAMVQPPMLRSADMRIEDIDRHDRPVMHSSNQRGVIRKTKILAKPEDRWSCHHNRLDDVMVLVDLPSLRTLHECLKIGGFAICCVSVGRKQRLVESRTRIIV